ncbi:dihydrofolate reductase family protein [Actinoplanes bogorensis]|uniref:Dihydrofolate reductase family protein n=1 Tax=Paractinoplanes bogorensis TaxID=1610840 RepID=A0ABS5Z3I5_9ACTN|nr:dihydrofolate reductase family protein [Actinoplanes bogorensis]MBU2669499.1 dihydrofolate reductase family protein [Actinoplanes bogorensis]
MRKITVGEFISLDGVVEAPDKWHMQYVNDEMMAAMYPADSDVDTLLLGRTTYDTFAGAFEHAPAEDPVAAAMNKTARVVVTSTPETVTWAGATPLTGDVITGVRDLKNQPGGSISVVGSTQLARTLLAAGLVDELSLILHPLTVGTGERLFPASGPGADFTLKTCTPMSTGVIHLVYTFAGGTR